MPNCGSLYVMKDQPAELALARRLVREAGQLVRRARETHAIVKEAKDTTYRDLSTSADLASEELIISGIERAYPGATILSEESRVEKPTSTEQVWIIDPLDGTANYVKGLDAYGVSIAIFRDEHVWAAVVYLPETDEEYYALRGGGVFRNEVQLKDVSAGDTLGQVLVGVGFPHTRAEKVIAPAFALYGRVLAASADLRRSGAASYETCLLAKGAIGAYLTPDIKQWDIAAMCLFVEEEGGVASDFTGAAVDLFRQVSGQYSTALVAARSASVHAELVSQLKITSSVSI